MLHKYPWMETHQHLVLSMEIAVTPRINEATAADRKLFRFAIQNVLHEILTQSRKTFELVELQANSFAVILHGEQELFPNRAVEQAIDLGKQLIRSIYDLLGIRLRVGIGSVQPHWHQISLSTEEAFMALAKQENNVCGDMEIYVYEKPDSSRQDMLVQKLRPAKFYHELAEAIRFSQEKQACEVVTRFVRTLCEIGMIKPSSLRKFGMECLAIIRYTLFDVGKNTKASLEVDDFEQSLLMADTPEAFENWLHDVVRFVCEDQAFNENIRHKQAVDFMIQYIHDHYHEDITLTDLADKVHFSRNYLSQLFRDAVGETFNSYLTKVRMERAKRLLSEGKYLIYEVAEMVGYKNIPYFSTLFKKETGCNPSDFLK